MPMTVIESACNQILVALKEGAFTRRDLEFMLKFFKKVVESTEKTLKGKKEERVRPTGFWNDKEGG
jgi:hypothetical protein